MADIPVDYGSGGSGLGTGRGKHPPIPTVLRDVADDLESIKASVNAAIVDRAAAKTQIDALVADIATIRTKVNAVLAKLDLDATVTDTNYAALHAIPAGTAAAAAAATATAVGTLLTQKV